MNSQHIQNIQDIQNNQYDIPLYNQLMSCISKNEKIPKKLEEIEKTPELHQKALILKEALLLGDAQSPIFHEEKWEDCLAYLLYLIKGNEKLQEPPLDENLAITALTYLMAIKSNNNPIKIININQDENYRKQYIANMIEKSKLSGIELNAEILGQEIQNLTGANAWVISTSFIYNSALEEEFVKDFFHGGGPYLYFNGEKNEYLVPSASIMFSFIKQINPNFIKFYPMFGRINELTLKKLHAAGFHPLEIYGGELVRNNLLEAHNLVLSPFIMMLHDFYHGYSGGLFDEDEHDYLFNNLIPQIEKLIEALRVKQHQPSDAITILILKKFVYELNDMDIGLFLRHHVDELDSGESIFDLWVESRGIFALVKQFGVSPDFSMFQQFPHLQNLVQFYFELYNTLPFNTYYNVLQVFTYLNPTIAGIIQRFNELNDGQFPAPFNAVYFNQFCNKQEEETIDQLLNLLNSCASAEEFIHKLLLIEHTDLFLKLIKSNCIYLAGAVQMDDQTLQLMKNELQTKKKCFTQSSITNQFTQFANKATVQPVAGSDSSEYIHPFKKTND